MKVAVASGKGGTGKTTVVAALAWVWDGPVTAVDLDVEAPNLHLFLKPEIAGCETASLEVPVVDQGRCTACGDCVEICQFKAITLLGDFLLTLPEMCHGCGGCLAVCPEGALSVGERPLGEVRWGNAGKAGFLMGRLRVGEAMSPPLIRFVRARLATATTTGGPGDVIIDAPPGTSCPAVNAVMDSDVILLVTEPTPFGHHDLRLAREAFGRLGKPMAVVVNRAGLGDRTVYDYCRATGLPIVAEIPFQHQIAGAYARGRVVAAVSPRLRGLFVDLAGRVKTLAGPDREVRYA